MICSRFVKSISDESDRPFTRRDDSPGSSERTLCAFDEWFNVEDNEICWFSIALSLVDVDEEKRKLE